MFQAVCILSRDIVFNNGVFEGDIKVTEAYPLYDIIVKALDIRIRGNFHVLIKRSRNNSTEYVERGQF